MSPDTPRDTTRIAQEAQENFEEQVKRVRTAINATRAHMSVVPGPPPNVNIATTPTPATGVPTVPQGARIVVGPSRVEERRGSVSGPSSGFSDTRARSSSTAQLPGQSGSPGMSYGRLPPGFQRSPESSYTRPPSSPRPKPSSSHGYHDLYERQEYSADREREREITRTRER